MMSGEDPPFNVATGQVRKLAALLSADVEGYGRLMGDDEAATVHTLTVYRSLVQSLVQEHRGRVVDSPGDNILAEFASAVDAVRCAVAMQRDLAARNVALPAHRRMRFRVGINVGDVIVEGDRIYGDGVNIAARLENLAEGGGICIAASVYEQVKGKLPLRYEDLGPQPVKNIAEPVHAYRVREERTVAAAPVAARDARAETSWRPGVLAAIALLAILGGGIGAWQLIARPWSSFTSKPSIAVLPFVNMSGDSEQEYFSDGMTEDVITNLSRLPGVLVIARNSVFTYKGRAVNPEQVRRELKVRYVLEGSVRKANNRVRITAQLVDATTGYHVWAQHYDRELQDIFSVQEEIATTVTKALAVRLTPQGEKYMGRPYTSSEVAWEYFMRGTELYRRFTPQSNARARELFEKAIVLDQDFARAYANLAATYRQDASMEWTPDYETSAELAYRMAHKAVDLARRELDPKPSLPYALEQWGYVLLYRRQHEEAHNAAEEAVQHSPSYADGYALGALVLIYSGKPEEALRKTQDAIARNPKYPFFYDYHRGQAHYVSGYLTAGRDPGSSRQHFDEAEKYLREALRKNGNFLPARAYLMAVLSELRRQDEAKNEAVVLRKADHHRDLREFQDYLHRNTPYKDQAIETHLTTVWSNLWREAGTRP